MGSFIQWHITQMHVNAWWKEAQCICSLKSLFVYVNIIKTQVVGAIAQWLALADLWCGSAPGVPARGPLPILPPLSLLSHYFL